MRQLDAEGDLVGARPPGGEHRGVQLLLLAEHREVHGVAEEPVARARAPDEVVGHVDGGEDAVQSRQHQVGEQRPEQHEAEDAPPAERERLAEQQVGEPDGGEAREHEEEAVEQRAEREPAPRRRIDHRTGCLGAHPAHDCMLVREPAPNGCSCRRSAVIRLPAWPTTSRASVRCSPRSRAGGRTSTDRAARRPRARWATPWHPCSPVRSRTGAPSASRRSGPRRPCTGSGWRWPTCSTRTPAASCTVAARRS